MLKVIKIICICLISIAGNMFAENQPTIFYPTQAYIAEIQQVWQEFLNKHSWQALINNIEPRNSNCGLVYELPNYLDRTNEGLAIIDMRNIKYIEPHYHPDPVVEIYFILQGTALVVVVGQEIKTKPGSIVVIFYRQAHFVIPDKDCVMAVVNIPPYQEDHYKVVTETNSEVGFDKEQFTRLVP